MREAVIVSTASTGIGKAYRGAPNATAAKQIIIGGMDVVAAGGQENISAVQDRYFGWAMEDADPNAVAKVQHAHTMLRTAEFVAEEYGASREAQDEYALQSQRRTAAAQRQDGSMTRSCRLYCRDHLCIDPALYNVNGGGISIGHSYGMTGARLVAML